MDRGNNMEPDSAVASNVRDSFPKGNNSSSAEHQDSHDPNKKKDKKKKKRQNKEVVREKKRAKHATDTTRAETVISPTATKESETSETTGTSPPPHQGNASTSSMLSVLSVKSSPPSLSLRNSDVLSDLMTTLSTSPADTSANSTARTLPRIPIATSSFSGSFVPRQVSRPKDAKPPVKRITTLTSTSILSTLPTSTVESKAVTPTATISTAATESAGSSVFRAKDIRERATAAAMTATATSNTTSPHNLRPFSQHYRTQPQQYSTQQQSQHDHHNRATSLSTPEQPLPEGTTVTSTGLIRAKPIMVTLDKHPGRVEFPYGNYPSYYEKRSREQKGTSKTKSTGEETARMPSSRTKSLSSVVMGSGPFGNQDNSVSKSLQGDHQQRQSQHFRTTTPSVLFPAHRSSSSLSLSSSTSSGSNPRTVQELAKSVDLRLEFLEGSWFRGKRVLDIGCNAGLLTVFIAMHYQPHKIEGVDIDPSLIGKAQNFVLKTFSQISRHAYLQEPLMPVPESSSSSFSSSSLESSSGAGAGSGAGTETNSRGVIGNCNSSGEPVVPYQAYFPKALQRMHGSLPIPVKTDKTQNLFPHNIELRIADWANEVDPTSAAGSNRKDTSSLNGSSSPLHDVILGFSLTKWIHLHNGDEGLKLFFKKIYRSLNPGGIFLMEPQAYNTYKKRSKLTKTIEEHYKAIKFMPDQFETFLLSSEVGFREMQHLGQSQGQAQNFNRPIILFRK